MSVSFEFRMLRRVVCAGALVAGFTASAHAQVISPERMFQRAPLTSEQLAQAFASATPMENIVPQNPLAARRSTDPQSGGGASIGRVDDTPPSSGGMGAADQGAPQVTIARPGRVESVGRRFMNMYPDIAAPSATGDITATGDGEIAPQNYGYGNLNTMYHFNDYQQVPVPVTYSPYRQVGRYLFQAADFGWYTCTAALINQAILITAGHCVHDGLGGTGTSQGWNRDGYFFPGFTNKFGDLDQRYGRCRTTMYSTTAEWYANGDIGQGEDVAMVLCGRLTDGAWRNSQNRLPGEVLGYFGFCYENCVMGYNFLTQVGYPANYHQGRQMTVSQHLEETAVSGGPDYLYGTGMRGGSSGGPHIQNIGNLWDHATDRGQNTQRNVIFAVTSWGYVSEALKIQGASPISGVANANNARSMYNMICLQSRSQFGNASCSLL